MKPLFIASFLLSSLCFSPAGRAEPAVGDSPSMAEGRKLGAVVVQLLHEHLQGRDVVKQPGIDAWLKGAGKIYNELNLEQATPDWRQLDADKLVTANPKFWQMYYEIAPGDPNVFMLHASALLTAGDACRSEYVIRLLLQSGDVNPESRPHALTILQHSELFTESPHLLVQKGIKQHDAGQFDAALATYQEAIDLWPRNGWAYYERGHTLRTKNNTVTDSEPAVLEAFSQCRRFQPLQIAAWQGKRENVPGMDAIYKHVMEPWGKMVQSLDYQMTDLELEAYGKALQDAGVDDLALVSRQALVHRRGKYVPEDHLFIAKSLRRLAPGEGTEATLKKLASDDFVAATVFDQQSADPPAKSDKR